MTKDELAAKYDQWVITSFSPAQVSMERVLALYCPEHVVLMPDESGQLCIFRNRYGDALALVRTRMDEGLSTKDAVKQVAKLTGFAKNQLYDAILKG